MFRRRTCWMCYGAEGSHSYFCPYGDDAIEPMRMFRQDKGFADHYRSGQTNPPKADDSDGGGGGDFPIRELPPPKPGPGGVALPVPERQHQIEYRPQLALPAPKIEEKQDGPSVRR